jgi:hypothetical protein
MEPTMADVLRVSILGALPSGEEWSVNPVWRIGPPADVATFGECSAAVTAINAITVPTGVRNMMNGVTTITGCRVEARSLGGTLEALAEGGRAVAITGQGTMPHPFQTALVTSLRTTVAGASGRGRLYWPATGLSLTAATLRPDTGAVTSAIQGVNTYLENIEVALAASFDADPLQLSVWSRTNSSTAPVVRLLMGDVPDTQRRRRDTLVETYQSLAWP